VLGTVGLCEPGSTDALIVIDEVHTVAERIAWIRFTLVQLCTQRPCNTERNLGLLNMSRNARSIRVSVDNYATELE